ncbi:hypothetical protein SAMN05444955_1022 [Lihuaxuella thermophila]|uniref:Uncharacterized protein n=2 Tax=Lihuaxuella thermophila TaxID=1173111 RepID=A0A1H8B6D1_9BACL|nr:hypothetical protein SAMN05444955_1022 [Lihuaxuella thermophila]
MKIDAQLFDTKIVTLELNQKLDWYHSEISRSAFWQNTVQVDTYEDRKKLLQYLSSQISAFDLKLWFVLQELRFHHNQMLNRNKMNKKDIQFMDENYEELKHEILIRRGFMKKLYQKYVTLYSNYEKLNRRLLKNKSNNRKNLLL